MLSYLLPDLMLFFIDYGPVLLYWKRRYCFGVRNRIWERQPGNPWKSKHYFLTLKFTISFIRLLMNQNQRYIVYVAYVFNLQYLFYRLNRKLVHALMDSALCSPTMLETTLLLRTTKRMRTVIGVIPSPQNQGLLTFVWNSGNGCRNIQFWEPSRRLQTL